MMWPIIAATCLYSDTDLYTIFAIFLIGLSTPDVIRLMLLLLGCQDGHLACEESCRKNTDRVTVIWRTLKQEVHLSCRGPVGD